MPDAQRAPTSTYGELSIGELLELVVELRGNPHERRLLAATLQALAAWLSEQSRALTHGDGSAPTLRALARRSVPGASALTIREREVAMRIARGLSNRQIAHELVIAVSTTERHVANILAKLDMRSRTQVVAWAVEHGLLGD